MLGRVSTAAARRDQVRQTRAASRARIVAAARDLLRTRSFAELTVDEVMREAGQGRTLFYRHFDDLADLLVRASREAIEELYAAQRGFADARPDDGPDAVRRALAPAVAVYHRHGPLLRAVVEAAAADPALAAQHETLRRRFDELAEQALRGVAPPAGPRLADVAQTAHALNVLNEAYLLDAFGGSPRVEEAAAAETLTEIWTAVIRR